MPLWYSPGQYRYSMLRFATYVRDRDTQLAEGLEDNWIPFVQRPSSKIPSCKDYTRRLVRKFRPRITKTAPVAIQRPRMAPMKWGLVR